MVDQVLDGVLELIQWHTLQRGKEPDCVVMTMDMYTKLEVELKGTLTTSIGYYGTKSVNICGVECYGTTIMEVTEMIAGFINQDFADYLRMPGANKITKPACECGAAAVNAPGHDWYCKLYTKNPYD